MNEPLLVIADHLRLAQQYAREHDLGREGRAWRFTYDWREIQGRRPGRFVRVTLGETAEHILALHREMAAYLRATGWEEL